MKIVFDILGWVIFFGVIVIVVITISSNSELFGGYRSFLVQSGSMEPTINIGDIVVIKKQQNYTKNDVVTFRDNDGRIVTHRIIQVLGQDTPTFRTKGDANRDEDQDEIASDQILGKVVFVIPKIGYLVAFSKTIPGLITLILVPASILIISQLIELKNG